MDFNSWPAHMILALILGALIGLEREINERKDLASTKSKEKTALLGLRTFSLVAGLGSIAGLLYFGFPLVSTALVVLFSALLLIFYVFDNTLTKDIGITTEIALIYSFLIGF